MCVCVCVQVDHLPESYNLQQTLLPNADSECVYVNVCVPDKRLSGGGHGAGAATDKPFSAQQSPSAHSHSTFHFLRQVVPTKATKVNNRKATPERHTARAPACSGTRAAAG